MTSSPKIPDPPRPAEPLPRVRGGQGGGLYIRYRRLVLDDDGGQEGIAILVGGQHLARERDHDHLANAGVIGDRNRLLEIDGARKRLLLLVEPRADRLEGSLIPCAWKLPGQVVDGARVVAEIRADRLC